MLATFLLYRLIQRGNLVQVTSLFYLIPAVTTLLDYLLLGHALAGAEPAGHGGHRARRDAGFPPRIVAPRAVPPARGDNNSR